MNKNNQKGFVRGKLNVAITMGLLGLSTMSNMAFAQTQPQAAPTVSPTQQPAQAVNPFGSVPPVQSQQKAPGISYGGQQSLDPQKEIQVPAGMVSTPTNPAAAAQAAGVGIAPPNGLPDYGTATGIAPSTRGMPQAGGQIDPVMVQMEILNTPDERIREIRKDLHHKARVVNEGPTVAPVQNKSVIVAHLSPGSTSPVVRVFKNITSTIIVTDMNGQPWPIINMDGLSSENFVVKRLDNPSPDGYVLSITPTGAFVSGNLVMILKGLPTPINIEFVPSQKEADVNTEIRVQARGPNAQYTSIGMPSSMDSALLSILQGVAPSNAKPLTTSTNAVQAWLARDGAMYVRTRYKVMAPAFENVTSSPDGTYAYKMVPVPSVLYKTEDGRFGEFVVEGL